MLKQQRWNRGAMFAVWIVILTGTGGHPSQAHAQPKDEVAQAATTSSAAEEAASAVAYAKKAAAAAAGSGAAEGAQKSASGVSIRSVPATVDFGVVRPGQNAGFRTVELSLAPATATSEELVLSTQGGFSVTPAKCNLDPGGTCSVLIGFEPHRGGLSQGALLIAGANGESLRVSTTLSAQYAVDCSVSGFVSCSSYSARWIVLVLFAYAALAIAIRWNLVARPTWEYLRGQIHATRAELEALPDAGPGDAPSKKTIEGLLQRAEDCLKSKGGFRWLIDRVLWSRGQDMSAWVMLHHVKSMLATRLSPEQVQVNLASAEPVLRGLNDASATALAEAIRSELDRPAIDLQSVPAAAMRELRAYLDRSGGSLLNDVADALNPARAVPVTTDQLSQLMRRVVAAIDPGQSLPDCLKEAEATSGISPEWLQIVRHARERLVPAANNRTPRMQALITANPSPAVSAWTAELGQWKSDHLTNAVPFGRRLDSAIASAPVAHSARRVELLREAISTFNFMHQTEQDELVTWHRKSLWLVGCSLSLVLMLSLSLGHALLFLAGALGGLLSRLSLAVNGSNMPKGYGAYWTTLMLSPIAGALAAWGGVLLLTVAIKLKILGEAVAALAWDQPAGPVMLGAAVLFGATERLFVRLVDRIGPSVVGPSTPETPPAAGGVG